MPGSHLYTPHGDIDELVASMITDLIYWRSLGNIDGHRTKCSLIYKVLQCIRASDPNAYEPRVLSIGPYHHGVSSSLLLEKEKWFCLDYVLRLNSKRSLHDYLAVITALERETRMCYSEQSTMNNRVFVEMLLLDACFILVCLNGIGVKVQEYINLSHSQDPDEQIIVLGQIESNVLPKEGKETTMESQPDPSWRTNKDFVLTMEKDGVETHHQNMKTGTDMKSLGWQNLENGDQCEQWYNSSAVYDLLLLENQIPYFVVKEVFDLLVGVQTDAHRLLSDNLSIFIEGVLCHFPLAIQDSNRPQHFDHLLHLCYMYFKPSRNLQHKHQMNKRNGRFKALIFSTFKYFGRSFDSKQKDDNQLSLSCPEDTHYSGKELQRWRRAEQYHDAGIEFKDREFDVHNPHSLLDIEFRDGVLHIPCLPIDDKFATLFRNLVVFEQSCPALGNDIASYIYFLSQLISVPDDVALLGRKGVIVHQLDSDEEVSALFTKLFDYVLFDSSGEHYLRLLCKTMEAHYQSRLNRWMAWLWHKHFANPWLGFTAFVSVIMVLCSIAQTILSFMSFISM